MSWINEVSDNRGSDNQGCTVLTTCTHTITTTSTAAPASTSPTTSTSIDLIVDYICNTHTHTHLHTQALSNVISNQRERERERERVFCHATFMWQSCSTSKLTKYKGTMTHRIISTSVNHDWGKVDFCIGPCGMNSALFKRTSRSPR